MCAPPSSEMSAKEVSTPGRPSTGKAPWFPARMLPASVGAPRILFVSMAKSASSNRARSCTAVEKRGAAGWGVATAALARAATMAHTKAALEVDERAMGRGGVAVAAGWMSVKVVVKKEWHVGTGAWVGGVCRCAFLEAGSATTVCTQMGEREDP